MIVQHKEGSIYILSPDDASHCIYKPHCPFAGDFRIVFKDDRDKIVTDYGNICDRHLIYAIMDYLAGE